MRELEDRPDRLETMLEDMRSASVLYRPTHFWDHYQRESYRYISSRGIQGFRSPRNRLWASFGAVADPLLGYARPLLGETSDGGGGSVRRALTRLARRLPLTGDFLTVLAKLTEAYETQLRMLLELSYQYCLGIDEENQLTRIGDSGLGSPNIVMEVDGRLYTIHFLRYFLQYLYLKRFVDFDRLNGIIEIGGGYGGMAEVLLKLHPRLRYIDIDIPPQVYVATQYLSACFPEKVIAYDETRDRAEIDGKDFPGKHVVLLCPWQLPRLKGDYALFINSASFQEMEPEVVENYADHLNRLVSRFGYIRAIPGGVHVAGRRGRRGVLEPTTREDYLRYFHTFELTDESPADVLPSLRRTLPSYRDMFFTKVG